MSGSARGLVARKRRCKGRARASVLCEGEELGQLRGRAKDVLRLLHLGAILLVGLVELDRVALLVHDEALVLVLLVVRADLRLAHVPARAVWRVAGGALVVLLLLLAAEELRLDLAARGVAVELLAVRGGLLAVRGGLSRALLQPAEAARAILTACEPAARVLLDQVVVVVVQVLAARPALLLARGTLVRVLLVGVRARSGLLLRLGLLRLLPVGGWPSHRVAVLLTGADRALRVGPSFAPTRALAHLATPSRVRHALVLRPRASRLGLIAAEHGGEARWRARLST